MGITPNFTIDDVRRYAERQAVKFVKATLAAYRAACIEMVNRAKAVNTYKDRTGSLRSSIGYVLYYDGQEIERHFEPTASENGSGGEGVKKGYDYARQIAESHGGRGIVAVVVAGMNYALYVEAKGYDVLTGSSRQFAGDLRGYLDDVNNQFGTEF